jgi:hypothetical protein
MNQAFSLNFYGIKTSQLSCFSITAVPKPPSATMGEGYLLFGTNKIKQGDRGLFLADGSSR